MLLMVFSFIILFLQLLGESIQYRTGYACEGSSLTITCEEPNFISLVRANFGRFSISICNQHGNVDWSVNCYSPEASNTIRRNCNTKSYCLLPASEAFFGDPCPGTYKYLEVHYECVPKVPRLIHHHHDSSLPYFNNGSHDGKSPKNLSPPPIIIPTVNPLLRNSNSSTNSPTQTDDDSPSSSLLSSSPSASASLVTSPSVSSPIGRDTLDRPSQAGIIMMPGNEDVNSHLSGSSEADSGSSSSQHHPLPPSQNRQSSATPSDKSRSDDVRAIYVPHPYPRPLATDMDSGSVDISTGNGHSSSKNSEQESRAKVDTRPLWLMNSNQLDQSYLKDYCLSSKQRDLWWNYTAVGQTASQPCPGGSKGEARWFCVRDERTNLPQWVPPRPDFSECNSLWMISLENRLRKGDRVISIAAELEQKIRTYNLYGGDIYHSTDVIHELVRKTDSIIDDIRDQRQRNQIVKELLISIQDACSNLLHKNHQDSWLELRPASRKEAATTLVYSLEKNSLLLADTKSEASDYVRAHDYIYLALHTREVRHLLGFPDHSPLPLPLPTDSADSETSLDNAYYHHFVGNSVELSSDAIYHLGLSTGFVRVLVVMFKRLDTILEPEYDTPSSLLSSLANGENVYRILNSDIIGAHLSPWGSDEASSIRPSRSTTTWITISFRHLLTQNITNPLCVHWDRSKLNWSDSGASMASTNDTHSVCEYDHLGYFGLIMNHIESTEVKANDGHQISNYLENEASIRLLLILGSVVNSILLLTGLITLLLITPIASKESRLIHNNALINLLLNHLALLLVLGADTYYGDIPYVFCGGSFGLLIALFHYFLLIHFVWILTDLIELYFRLTHKQHLQPSHRQQMQQLPLTHHAQLPLHHLNAVPLSSSLPVAFYSKKIRRTLYASIYLIPFLVILLISWSTASSFSTMLTSLCLLESRSHLASFVIAASIILAATGLILWYSIHRHIKIIYSHFSATSSIAANGSSGPPPTSAATLAANIAAMSGDKYPSDSVINRKLRLSLFFRFGLTIISAINCTLSVVYLTYKVTTIGYLYAITNFLLGLFVFVYYCMCKERIRTNYVRICHHITQPFMCWKNGGKSVYMNSALHAPPHHHLSLGRETAVVTLKNASIANLSPDAIQQPIINISSSMGSINPECAPSKHYLSCNVDGNQAATGVNNSVSSSGVACDVDSGSDYGCRRLQASSHNLYHLYNAQQPCNPYSCHHMIEHVYECIDEAPYVAKVLLPKASNMANYRVHHVPRHLLHHLHHPPPSASSGHHHNIHSLAYHNLEQLRNTSVSSAPANPVLTTAPNISSDNGQTLPSSNNIVDDLILEKKHLTLNSGGEDSVIRCLLSSSSQLGAMKLTAVAAGSTAALPAIVSDNNGRRTIICNRKSSQNLNHPPDIDGNTASHPSMMAVLSANNRVISSCAVSQQGINI